LTAALEIESRSANLAAVAPYAAGCARPAYASEVSHKSALLSKYLTKGASHSIVSEDITVQIESSSIMIASETYYWNLSNPQRYGLADGFNGTAPADLGDGEPDCSTTGTCNECFWLTVRQTGARPSTRGL
jgi:hypothetical protein